MERLAAIGHKGLQGAADFGQLEFLRAVNIVDLLDDIEALQLVLAPRLLDAPLLLPAQGSVRVADQRCSAAEE